jgi:hypothetical protein
LFLAHSFDFPFASPKSNSLNAAVKTGVELKYPDTISAVCFALGRSEEYMTNS